MGNSMLLWLVFVWTVLLACTPVDATDRPKKAANILFILIDDFGQRDLSCYGSKVYETPNLDSVAKAGARFTQAYVTYPRCVPSRFSILTGKHPAAFQKNRDSVHVEPNRDVTFGEPFRAAGYSTFYCGKWHLGDDESLPEKRGFTTTILRVTETKLPQTPITSTQVSLADSPLIVRYIEIPLRGL
jgi:arylsulfatase A-like enzyme